MGLWKVGEASNHSVGFAILPYLTHFDFNTLGQNSY